ncbi:ATP-grasp domain-containing protein [Raineyella sp.]|uniref:ATP-grasp domain-containing protein n=1 Tax=bioreactor metagenome TaxID=1076179 RepID=A0A644XNM1_9ZZZZ|nr:ATP-grasp domain-containing protein [Raineyella sp.]MEA5153823.1 ATP-grasp domain-containing protein [Raineyella sp.]
MTRRTAMVGVNRNAAQQLRSSGASPTLFCEEPELWEAKQLTSWLDEVGLSDAKLVWFDYQHEPPTSTAAVAQTLRSERIDGVLPGLEYAVEGAAALASSLGLPGAGVEAAHILRNKALLREATSHCAWGTVPFRHVTSAEDLADFLAGQPNDVIVKPVDRQASLGVVRLAPGADVRAAWVEVVGGAEPNQTIHGWVGLRQALVEECLVGDECSVEALVRDGAVVWVNLTAKHVLEGEHRVEIGHEIVPVEEWCWQTMQELVEAVHFRSGLLHAEFMRTARGPRLIECAGRPPGDQILNLIEQAWGFSPTAAWSAILCGDRPTLPTAPRGRASVAFVYSTDDGVVDVVPDRAVVPPQAVVSVTVTPQQEVRRPRSSWDRLGYVVTSSDMGLRGNYAESRTFADLLRPRLSERL